MTKIAFIGLGNMGGTLARIVAQTIPSKDLLLANRSPEKAEILARKTGGQVATNEQVMQEADVIFLGVKPAQFAQLFADYQTLLEKRESLLFISMAAGLQLTQLESYTAPQHRFIRMMPNTPVGVGQGVITFALSNNAQSEDKALFLELLETSSEMVELDEKQLDAATALAGCGPAFVYQFIEALSDAGVKNGLTREVALRLAAQTVLGSAQMVKETATHPAILKDQVCSPGGSTIAGVASLETSAFRGSVIEAVDAAYQRTQELGR